MTDLCRSAQKRLNATAHERAEQVQRGNQNARAGSDEDADRRLGAEQQRKCGDLRRRRRERQDRQKRERQHKAERDADPWRDLRFAKAGKKKDGGSDPREGKSGQVNPAAHDVGGEGRIHLSRSDRCDGFQTGLSMHF